MDRIDFQIIAELQRNGRLSNQALSDKIGLSPSSCLKRMRDLEKEGLITGYTALIDQKKFGLPVTVFLRIRLDDHAEETVAGFEREIERLDEVQDCFLITGDADYQLRVIVRDLDDYELLVRRRLQRIKGVASIDSSVAFGTVKRAHTYPRHR